MSCLGLYWDRDSYFPDCSQTHYVGKDDPELLIFLALPPLQMFRFQSPTTMPNLCGAEHQAAYFVNARSALCQLSHIHVLAHLPLRLHQQVIFPLHIWTKHFCNWSTPFSIWHSRCLIAITTCSIISLRVPYNMFRTSSFPSIHFDDHLTLCPISFLVLQH